MMAQSNRPDESDLMTLFVLDDIDLCQWSNLLCGTAERQQIGKSFCKTSYDAQSWPDSSQRGLF